MKTRLFRVVAVATATTTFISASATGLNAVFTTVAPYVSQILRGKPGQFTKAPGHVFLGTNPGRAPRTRGGLWSEGALADAKAGGSALWACMSPEFLSPQVGNMAVGQAQTAVAVSSGSTLPWEASAPTASGSVNTGNGDKLTQVPMFSWKCRGALTLDFTLYQNSEGGSSGPFGYGWSSSYNDYVALSGTTATVHWADGLCVPFTASGSGSGGTGTGGTQEEVSGGSSTSYTPPTGIHDTLVENASGTWTLTKKDQTVYTFNTSGYLTQVTDRNGNSIVLTRNANNYLTQITDPSGRAVSLTLSSSNQYTAVSDPLGRTWSFTINSSGDLTKITWPALNGNTYTDQFAYSSHDIVTHTDRAGNAWTATYLSSGDLASETNPLGHTTTYSYTSSATTITDALSHSTVYNYSSGLLASVVDPNSFSEAYVYDSSYNVKQYTDKNSDVWKYTYDSNANVLTETDPLSHEWVYTYNSTNDLLTKTDPLSNETLYAYSSAGNLVSVTDPLSHVTSYGYDSYGERISETNALNNTVSFSYDTNGDLTSVTDAAGDETQMAYDGVSRLVSTTDAVGNVESISYDVWSRPVTWTHADDSAVTKTYNAVGQVLTTTDELQHTTTLTYDATGRLTGRSNANGESESYGYDNANRLASVTNGNGKARSYTYTARGDLSTLTLADGSEEQWSHDGNGNVTAYTNPLSQVIDYTFDAAGRKTGITYPAGTNPAFTYDNANRVTGMTDATGTTSWTYDAASRLTALSTPQGNMSYTYDAANRRATMVEGVGTTTYGYDVADRMTSLVNPYSETTSWTYDADSRVTQETLASGAYTVTGYDDRSRATSIAHYQSGGTALSSESYVYDVAGNLSSKTVNSVTTSYTYDDVDQLLSETAPSYTYAYTYDANGNRLTKTLNGTQTTYTYDSGDKMLTAGSNSYAYDAAGRTTGVTTSAGTTTIAYDYENRITQITYPSGSTNTFTYNALDTRVGKVDSTGTYTYKRDDAGVTDNVLSDGSSAYTPGISVRNSGASTFQHGDRLGTFSLQTNASQTATATRQYDAFGNLLSSTGTPVGAFGFAGSSGYQEDSDSSLKLLGHRYYDPSTGRFLTRDPAKDGRNWYGYCRNNPLHSTDRTGLVGGDGEDEAIVAELAEEAADEAADEAAAGGGGGGGGESTIGDGGGQGSGEAGGEGSGEGSNSCFTAGTLIAMADGSAKAIESVKAGDRVLTRDQKAAENAKTTSAGVARTYVKHPRETLVLKFADGATVHTTPGHRFYVHAKGFVHAKDLKVGFMIAESGKGLDRVASVARFLKPATVYNFEVSGKHTYFIRAGNAWLWVHNNCKPYSAGKAQQTVERGQAPDTIDRVDNPHGPAQPEPHVHNTGGGGSTISQQPTHGGWGYRPTNAEVKWFIRIGWPIPKWPL